MKVVTFYSFKGGVGRSLALANIALLLATHGRRVLAVDFDLEAPGLSMMSDLVPNPREVERGLFEYLLALLNGEEPNLSDYLIYPKIEGPDSRDAAKRDVDLAFLPAGNLNGYDLSKLDFARLLEDSEHNPLSQFRSAIEALEFTYALLDSRTGMTEIAATCTLGLADVVVMFSGLNDQNLQGTRWVLDMLEREGGLRSENIIVVFSPIPEAEEELKSERLQRAREIVGNRDILLLPYHPRLALIEELFVKEWKETSLAQKYRQLASEISQRNPNDIEAIIAEGKRLLQDAKIDKSKEKFDKALQINSTDAEANLYAGNMAHIQKRYEDAERYYRRSIEANEKEPESWRSLGELLSAQDRFEEALDCWHHVIELNPEDAGAHVNWGRALGELARRWNDESLFEESIRKFRKTIEINPNLAEAYSNLGASLVELAKFRNDESLLEEAIRKCQKAIEIDPDFAGAYSNWGSALTSLAKRRDDKSLFEESIQKFRKAIEINVNLEEAYLFHINLAYALIQIGEYEEAEEHCLRTLKSKKYGFVTHNTYGELLLKMGRLEEAEKHFLSSLELKEDEPETHEHYAQLLCQMGRSEKAEVHERRAQELRK